MNILNFEDYFVEILKSFGEGLKILAMEGVKNFKLNCFDFKSEINEGN